LLRFARACFSSPERNGAKRPVRPAGQPRTARPERSTAVQARLRLMEFRT